MIRVAAAATGWRQELPGIVRFGLVGLCTTAIDIGVFSVLIGAGLLVPIANFFSYSCGIVASYALNRRFTFKAEPSRVRALKFVTATLAGLLLSTALVWLFDLILQPVVSKVLTVPIIFVWNYMTARLWVFRQR